MGISCLAGANSKVRGRRPELVLVQEWTRQQLGPRRSQVIVAQVQLSEAGVFGVENRGQRSTSVIGEQAA